MSSESLCRWRGSERNGHLMDIVVFVSLFTGYQPPRARAEADRERLAADRR